MRNIVIHGYKFILISTALITMIIIVSNNSPNSRLLKNPQQMFEVQNNEEAESIFQELIKHQFLKNAGMYAELAKNWKNFTDDEKSKLSNLGRILFLGEEPPPPMREKTFQILFWKYGSTIENRHLKRYSDKRIDPFEKCSVKNCDITFSDEAIQTADIVIFHLHRTKDVNELPQTRNPNQIWAFLTDESPYNTFLKRNIKLSDFDGKFNWSMTYRMDSDIPVPYGRTVRKKNTNYIIPHKRKDVLVAAMGSNCGGKNKRWDYVKELQKYINVDVYGGCGPNKCPGHFRKDCEKINDYMFYLAFENSNCDEYVTEKLWWNAYAKSAIPIVMGANTRNYSNLLPPFSYLNVENFAKPTTLADYIRYLNITDEYLGYYQWKNDFEVLQEHGYFGSESYHFCRICEALNYNEKNPKIYTNLTDFWDPDVNCYPAWNEKTAE